MLVQFKDSPEIISVSTTSKKKYAIYKFLGLGCSSNKHYQTKSHTNLYHVCDPFHNAVKDVMKKKFVRELSITKFVKQNAEDIKKEIDSGKHVLLLGHSYGGSVAIRIAKMLSDRPNVDQIHLSTFGSIMVEKVPNIKDQVHYMYIGDVVMKLLHLREPKESQWDPENNVMWMKHPTIKVESKLKRALAVFGTTKEWEIHHDYTNLQLTEE